MPYQGIRFFKGNRLLYVGSGPNYRSFGGVVDHIAIVDPYRMEQREAVDLPEHAVSFEISSDGTRLYVVTKPDTGEKASFLVVRVKDGVVLKRIDGVTATPVDVFVINQSK